MYVPAYSLYELLTLKHCMSLQHLKVVFLICSMLVHDEQVFSILGNDEAQVKLHTQHNQGWNNQLVEDDGEGQG